MIIQIQNADLVVFQDVLNGVQQKKLLLITSLPTSLQLFTVFENCKSVRGTFNTGPGIPSNILNIAQIASLFQLHFFLINRYALTFMGRVIYYYYLNRGLQ